ncbi:MAG: hypothetical protein K2F92_01825, partial [Alistipes sp.]|nr:hypothetical protein [Alistipes sp.]
MKKLLLSVATSVLFSSCSFSAYDKIYDKIYYTDFTRYAYDNFFVSSITDYTGSPYVALGDITIEHYPGSGDKQELSDAQDMLDRLVRAAKNRGANGIIGYTCDLTMTKYGPSKWIASGVAVHFDKLPN